MAAILVYSHGSVSSDWPTHPGTAPPPRVPPDVRAWHLHRSSGTGARHPEVVVGYGDAAGNDTGVLVVGLGGVTLSGDLQPLDADHMRPITEVAAAVIRSYLEHGISALHSLDLDGALVLHDPRAGRVIAWRDPAGTHPLYYHQSGRDLIIASDLRLIRTHPASPGRIDHPYLRAFFQNTLFQHRERTLIDGVSKVPAGHLLVATGSSLRLDRHWAPEKIAVEAIEPPEAERELLRLVARGVDRQLQSSNGTVGAHLSGGLDSSSLAVLANRRRSSERELHTFSWAPSPERYPLTTLDADERHLAISVASQEDLQLHFCPLTSDDVAALSCRDLSVRPRAALELELATSRQARELDVRTMLSGWGGDEGLVFNGRGYFAGLARGGRLLTVHRELRQRQRLLGGSLAGAWKSRVFLPLAPDAVFERLVHPLQPPIAPLPPGVSPQLEAVLRDITPLPQPTARERPGAHRMQRVLLAAGHVQFRIEAWFAHGLDIGMDYRFPLLSGEILRFALSLPERLYFLDGQKRWLYRTAMRDLLPDEVRWNPHKFDSSMGRQYSDRRAGAFPPFAELLASAPPSPLVDADAILEQARAAARPSESDEAPHATGLLPHGGASWLAFTDLLP